MTAGDVTTREERLAWSPEQALSLVDGSDGTEAGTAALAMVDQLVSARVPLDALELSLVYWSRALDGLSPGPVPPARLARLDDDLALERAGSPVLARWLDALRGRVGPTDDLEKTIRFLMKVRTTWVLVNVVEHQAPAADAAAHLPRLDAALVEPRGAAES